MSSGCCRRKKCCNYRRSCGCNNNCYNGCSGHGFGGGFWILWLVLLGGGCW